VTCDGRSYEFEKVGVFGNEQAHVVGGKRLGAVRRTGFWRTGAEADLPDVPRLVAVFTFAVALLAWQRDDASAG
jgi:hypothetical protein